MKLTTSQERILERHCRTRDDLYPLFGRQRQSGYALERKGLGRVVTTQVPQQIWFEGRGWLTCLTSWYFKVSS